MSQCTAIETPARGWRIAAGPMNPVFTPLRRVKPPRQRLIVAATVA